jgi:hypothetical protein
MGCGCAWRRSREHFDEDEVEFEESAEAGVCVCFFGSEVGAEADVCGC